jgi:ferredoxin
LLLNLFVLKIILLSYFKKQEQEMLREIVTIDEEKCNGCGNCVPGCPEGALQIIDGKARLVSDLFCDGLGACIGECPENAITVEKRESEPYDEKKTMKNIIPHGTNTIKAHLSHLLDHGEKENYKLALEALEEEGMNINQFKENKAEAAHHGGGCPGSRVLDFGDKNQGDNQPEGDVSSQLRQWPVQMHLVSPQAPYFQSADLLLAADCTAFALGDFHSQFLKGKALGIACPKLDDNTDIYIEKITALIDEAKVNTITVMIMQVPCCGGLLHFVREAIEKANRKVPVKAITVSLQGKILNEEWI